MCRVYVCCVWSMFYLCNDFCVLKWMSFVWCRISGFVFFRNVFLLLLSWQWIFHILFHILCLLKKASSIWVSFSFSFCFDYFYDVAFLGVVAAFAFGVFLLAGIALSSNRLRHLCHCPIRGAVVLASSHSIAFASLCDCCKLISCNAFDHM